MKDESEMLQKQVNVYCRSS